MADTPQDQNDDKAPGADQVPEQDAPADNVVPLPAKKKAAKSASKRAPKPDAESERDSASDGGEGKRDKPIDWGKFNRLLDGFTLIYGTDQAYDGVVREMMALSAMAHAHGSDLVRLWKESPERKTVLKSEVVFDPSRKCPAHWVNLYGGMALKPAKGTKAEIDKAVEPILELLDFLVSRAGKTPEECAEIKHWVLCWLAYPLQNPGAKMRTAVIMHGDEGAGKNFLFDLVVDIYGEYGALVGQDELEDKFNDWRSAKLFVVGDEVSSRAELVHNKNRLKALITSPTVQINPKGLARRKEANHMNIAFLSNELQPLALDNSDRRYLVVYTPRAREREYYKALGDWKDAGGAAAFYAYLLAYDVGDFGPYSPAPFTEAKKDLIDINRKSPERFWADWHAGLLDLPYHSCEVDQAYQAYFKFCQRIGDRFPVQRELFSRLVLRFAEGQGHPVRIQSMQVNDVGGGGRKARRMLLVCEPIFDGVKQGEWAGKTWADFGKHLSKYLHGGAGWPRSPSEEEQGTRGNGGDE